MDKEFYEKQLQELLAKQEAEKYEVWYYASGHTYKMKSKFETHSVPMTRWSESCGFYKKSPGDRAVKGTQKYKEFPTQKEMLMHILKEYDAELISMTNKEITVKADTPAFFIGRGGSNIKFLSRLIGLNIRLIK